MSPRGRDGGGFHDSLSASMVKGAMRAASNRVGRQIARGLLGGILGGSGDGGSLSVILSEAKNLRFISLHERD